MILRPDMRRPEWLTRHPYVWVISILALQGALPAREPKAIQLMRRRWSGSVMRR